VTAAHQQKQIEALTAGLQKVSAQVEMSANLRRKWSTIPKAGWSLGLGLSR